MIGKSWQKARPSIQIRLLGLGSLYKIFAFFKQRRKIPVAEKQKSNWLMGLESDATSKELL